MLAFQEVLISNLKSLLMPTSTSFSKFYKGNSYTWRTIVNVTSDFIQLKWKGLHKMIHSAYKHRCRMKKKIGCKNLCKTQAHSFLLLSLSVWEDLDKFPFIASEEGGLSKGIWYLYGSEIMWSFLNTCNTWKQMDLASRTYMPITVQILKVLICWCCAVTITLYSQTLQNVACLKNTMTT